MFDRTYIIEKFYTLYLKVKSDLIKNIKDSCSDNEKEEFSNNLLIQLLIVWYLQEKEFLNDDKLYLIHRFADFKKLGFKNYCQFLQTLFEIMINKPNNGIFHIDKRLGKIIVTGKGSFITGENFLKNNFKNIRIPDEVFYSKFDTKVSQNTDQKRTNKLYILNLLQSQDWSKGNFDEYVLCTIYEKILNETERKKHGVFYTPEWVTRCISKNIITQYITQKLAQDGITVTVNELKNYILNEIDEKELKFLFTFLNNIKILDPSVGSAHFLESIIEMLVEFYLIIIQRAKKLRFTSGFEILSTNNFGNIEKINILNINKMNDLIFHLKFFIILAQNIYGVDINLNAIKMAKTRLFLSLAKHFNKEINWNIPFSNIKLNLKCGDALLGFKDTLNQEKNRKFTLNLINSSKKYDLKNLIINYKNSLILYSKKLSQNFGTIIIFEEEIENISVLLNQDQISWNDFLSFLKFKNKLTKLLVISQSLDYNHQINKILYGLNTIFREKLNEVFLSLNHISSSEQKNLNPFHWILEFPDIFLDNGGFDIIIGNPPYVNIKDSYDRFVIYKKFYKKISFGKTDLYVLFFGRGLNLLKETGLLGYITSNVYLKSEQMKDLRYFLKKNCNILELTDFGGNQIFNGATTYTAITILKKETPNSEFQVTYNRWSRNINKFEIEFCNAEKKNNFDTLQFMKFTKKIPMKNFTDIWWFEPYPIIKKMRNNNIKLSERAIIKDGLVTSKDPYFIGQIIGIDGSTNNIASEGKKGKFGGNRIVKFQPGRTNSKNSKIIDIEENILKPILFGKQTKRYMTPIPKYYIIFPHKIDSINQNKYTTIEIQELKNNFPLAWNYFESYKSEFGERVRDAKSKTKYKDLEEFYMIHRPRVPSLFLKDVIITMATSNHGEFTLNSGDYFFVGGTAGVYGIVMKPESKLSIYFILGCLNSKLYTYYFKAMGRIKRGGYHQLNKKILAQTPFIDLQQIKGENLEKEYSEIIDLTRKCLIGKNSQMYEEEIDQIIYKIFKLDKKEQNFIESSIYGKDIK